MKKNVMTKTQEKDARSKLKALEKQLGKCGPLMRGTIVTNGVKHRQAYFSLNKDKKTHLIYLGEGRLPLATKMSENYKRLLEIVEEMTVLNMALLKNMDPS
jgi:hypothetical protein